MTSYGSGPGGTPQEGQPNVPPGGQAPAPGPQPVQYGPPPGYAPPPPSYTQPGAPPPPVKGRSPLLIIGIIVLVLVVLCGVGGALLVGGVLNATQPVANAGEAYIAALRDGDYNKAFDLSSPSLQREAGDAAGLEAALSFKQPASWSITSRSFNNNLGNLSGTVTYKDGTNGNVDMALEQIGNEWKVSGINLR